MLPGDARGNRLCLNSPHTWPESRRRKSKESNQEGKREDRGRKRKGGGGILEIREGLNRREFISIKEGTSTRLYDLVTIEGMMGDCFFLHRY